MVETKNRSLIGDRVIDQIDAGKAAHGVNLNQGLFHLWIAECIPLLLQVDPQYGRQWVRRPVCLLAALGVVGLDQCDQRLLRHYHLHLREKLIAFGLLLGRGQLVVRKGKLLAAHHPCPNTQSQGQCYEDGQDFPATH